jgi:RND superfamily putative drug exporter
VGECPTHERRASTAPRRRPRWLLPALLILRWLGIGGVGGPYQRRLAEVQENDSTPFLPADAEATRVAAERAAFADDAAIPAVVVFERAGGSPPRTPTTRSRRCARWCPTGCPAGSPLM